MKIWLAVDGSKNSLDSTSHLHHSRAAGEMRGLKAACILGPAFIVAGIAEVVFFVLVDPIELHLVARVLGISSHLIWYTAGFLLFLGFAAASSALSYVMLLQTGAVGPGRRVAKGGGCPARRA